MRDRTRILPSLRRSYTHFSRSDVLSIYPWSSGLLVSHCFKQTFINVSNWKLPLRLRFPHLPIFKCRRRRAHCEKPGAAAFLILLWKCLDKRQFANDFFDFKLKTNPKQIYHVYTENTDFKDYKVRFWHKKKLYGKNIIGIILPSP